MVGIPRNKKLWQRITFIVMFFGYTCYMLDRKSFAFIIPNISKMENLENEAIGSILSSFAMAYAIGKFGCSILVDSFSPKYMLAFGLTMCGAMNLAFSMTTSPALYNVLWFGNGLFQGFGWPACAKLLTRWYSPAIFGTLWSLLSTSMNVASSLGPAACNYIIDVAGSWRCCMQVFAALSFIVALAVLLLIKDNPPSSDAPEKLDSEQRSTVSTGQASSSNSAENTVRERKHDSTEKHTGENEVKKQKQKVNFFVALKRVLSSSYLYIVSYAFFVSLLFKGAICDWGPLYIITEKRASKGTASLFSGCIEMGGLTGSIISGFVTDWILSKRLDQVKGNPRNIFMIPCGLILITSMFLLRTTITDVNVWPSITMLLAFCIGFCVYGMISLIGVMTIEKTSADISGTSHAVAALFGNLGMTAGGLPFSMVIEKFSWSAGFFLVECLAFGLVLTLVLSETMVCRIGDVKEKED